MSPIDKPGFNDDKTAYYVNGKDFPILKASGSATHYVPIEALEETLKLFPDKDPFGNFEQLKIGGVEYPTITDPADGQTFVPLDALLAVQEDLQSQLGAMKSKGFVDGADKDDLVYVNTGSAYVIGVTRKNLADLLVLDSALVIDHNDYPQLKEKFVKRWFEGLDSTDKDKEKAIQVATPSTPLSFMLMKYLTEQNIAKAAKECEKIGQCTIAFFRDAYPTDEEYRVNISEFEEVTTNIASRDIVEKGYQVRQIVSAVNLSDIPVRKDDDGKLHLIFKDSEIYQVVRALYFAHLLRKDSKRASEVDMGISSDHETLEQMAKGENGIAQAADTLLTGAVDDNVTPSSQFSEAVRDAITGDGTLNEIGEEVIEDLEPISDYAFKGWELGSYVDTRYGELSNENIGLEKRVRGIPTLERLFQAKKLKIILRKDDEPSEKESFILNISDETARKDKYNAMSLAKIMRAIVEGEEIQYSFRIDETKRGSLLPQNTADLITIIAHNLDLPIYNAQLLFNRTSQKPVLEKLMRRDLATVSGKLAEYFQKHGKEIEIDWVGNGNYKPLFSKEDNEGGAALLEMCREINPSAQSHQRIVEVFEVAKKLLDVSMATQDLKKAVNYMISEQLKKKPSQREMDSFVSSLRSVCNVTFTNPEELEAILSEKSIKIAAK
jgi:hypothetical protein